MKGLLIKDLYTLWGNSRIYLLFLVVVGILAGVYGENLFLLFYPVILIAALPVTVLSIDERDGWLRQADTMPVTRRAVVSSKYLLLLILVAAETVLLAVTYGASCLVRGIPLATAGLEQLIVLVLLAGILPGAVMIPGMFKLGVEKGYILFIAVIVAVCVLLGIMSNWMAEENSVTQLQMQILESKVFSLPVLLLLCAAAGIVSYALSVRVYEKREL